MVVANFSEEEQEWSPPQATVDSLRNGTIVLANCGRREELRGHSLTLRPFESFVVLEQESGHHLYDKKTFYKMPNIDNG